MRVGRTLLIVGIITISSMFYIYQQCVVAFRPLQKRVERLASFDFDYESKVAAKLGGDSLSAEDMVNGEFSKGDTQLQVAKK